MSTSEEEFQQDPAILQRTNLPGMFLTWVGILNMVMGLLLLQAGIHNWKMTFGEYQDEQRKTMENLRKLGWGSPKNAQDPVETPTEGIKATLTWLSFLAGAGALAGAFIIAYAGFNLRALNSYKLAVAGSVLAMIPVISPLGCCLIGQVVGIWSLVILLDRDVRAAFP